MSSTSFLYVSKLSLILYINLLTEQLNSNLKGSLSVKVEDNTISTLEKDPWGVSYKIRYKSAKNTNELEIASAGPDMQFNTPDDIVGQIIYEDSEIGPNITVIETEISKTHKTSHVCLLIKKL